MKETTVLNIRAASSENAEVINIPLYSSRPAAGFPAPGDDLVEKSLDLNDLLIDNPTATFFVKVEGDSMEGAKIFSGDVLVVDRSVTPSSGHIVVAAVYGEMVVKRLIITGKDSRLVSENAGYEPIVLTSNDECFIWGVVIGSARVF
ncbi:MAG TPA: translesion error-prone DNA polymerase V autoproteolytic subunit [Candidatus Paceibacterota bacterium]|nr:translesion error-prone DNA polymerase V autoproteolytic subunit [Candidatus Paceibacterota bacterium]